MKHFDIVDKRLVNMKPPRRRMNMDYYLCLGWSTHVYTLYTLYTCYYSMGTHCTLGYTWVCMFDGVRQRENFKTVVSFRKIPTFSK